MEPPPGILVQIWRLRKTCGCLEGENKPLATFSVTLDFLLFFLARWGNRKKGAENEAKLFQTRILQFRNHSAVRPFNRGQGTLGDCGVDLQLQF